jgi:hypothetical protein
MRTMTTSHREDRPMPATGTRIDPAAVYDDAALYSALEISYQALARARREGRLRFTRKGRRILYLGEWVIEWLSDGATILASKGGAPQ